jgi:hypothetical protein
MAKMRLNRHVVDLIADLRSLPHGDGGSALHHPKQVGLIVDLVLKNVSMRSRCDGVLLENWALVVGENFSERCSPITVLQNGILLVSCCNAVVRNELEFKRVSILANIAALPRCKHIRDLRFRLI